MSAKAAPKIVIGEGAGEFTICIDNKRFRFDQEESVESLVDMFKELGLESTYEEWY